MRRKSFLVPGLVFILLPAVALALSPVPVSPPQTTPSSMQRIDDPAGGQRWVDMATGAMVAGFDLEAGPFSGTAERQARAFLAAAGGELGLREGTADLELVYVKETPLGEHVRFQQTLGGIAVFESDVVVTIARRSGRVVSVMSRYRVGVAAGVGAAAVSAEAARGAAIAAIGATEERIGPETEPALGYLPVAGRVVLPLVYRVVIPAAQPIGDWEVMVDATSGEVLRVVDQVVSVDGSGKTFDPDPLTTAGASYTDPGYGDGNDANTPQLEAQTFVRTLRDITFSGGLYRLTGPYCNIADFEAPSGAPVTSASPSGFVFTRDAQGFEDVVVYYGIDLSQRHIQSLGFTNIQNGAIWCDPHGVSGADNSHYVPSSNRLAWGEGGVDDSEDLDVIWHEYGHAIQHGSVPGWGGPAGGLAGDAGAMGEGFGDFWAGSHSAAVSLFRWFWCFNWDGHNNFWAGRLLNHTGHYPQNWNPGLIHDSGQLWSSTLMQIWFEINRDVTDRLVLQHHFLLGTTPLVTQAAAGLVTADENINEGLNVDTIVNFCTQRGFFTPAQYEIPSITHTPLADTDERGPYPVTAVCTSLLSGIGSVEVRYGTGGSINGSEAMTLTGNPDEYSGEIPDLGNNVTVNYFIVAQNNADPNRKATDPRPAPSGALHAFEVAGALAVASAEVTPGRFALGRVHPNPFVAGSRIKYSLGGRAPVRLAIYSVAGDLVRVLVEATEEADVHEVSWDGRDASGKDVGAGVYWARLDAGTFRAARKLVVLH